MLRLAIIGGGPGGLVTAYFLDRKCNRRISTTLFEATDRVGGKIVTRLFDNAPYIYEAGVAEIYGYHRLGPDPLRRIIKNLGLPTVPMQGGTVVLGNRIMRDAADIKRHFGKKTLKAIQDFRRKGSTLLSPSEYYNAGWPCDNRHAWKRQSFDAILDRIPDGNARRYLRVAVHSDLASEPHEVSGFFGLENCLMDDPRYVRLYSIEGGLERFPQALRTRITADVRLNHQVTSVEKESGQYRVTWRHQGCTNAADYDCVVVALPNCWLPAIHWSGKSLETAMRNHHAYYDLPAHYLRITVLFREPFWRKLISGSYFQLDAFGGCCVYDEGTRHEAGSYGVLSWLLGGQQAMLLGNEADDNLIRKALDSLPISLRVPDGSFIEGHVHRWVGVVTAEPDGHIVKGAKLRHLPDPKHHPGLLVVGDYLFDSTINGVVDSSDIVTDLVAKLPARQHHVRAHPAGAAGAA